VFAIRGISGGKLFRSALTVSSREIKPSERAIEKFNKGLKNKNKWFWAVYENSRHGVIIDVQFCHHIIFFIIQLEFQVV